MTTMEMIPAQIRWTILFITLFLAVSTALKCSEIKTDKDCYCFEYDSTDLQCPKVESKIRVSVFKHHEVTLQCLENRLDIDIIPSLNMSNAKSANVEYCFLNNNFSDILLGKFRMLNLNSLTFESVNINQEIPISRESLEPFHTLNQLTLSFSTVKLKPDFLTSTPDLISLILDKNSITKLDRYFDYVPKLKLLDISGNLFQFIPDGVFEKLTNLTKLMLYNNKITTLTNTTFMGLKKLKVLELSANQIQELPVDTFAQLELLSGLSLRGNNIKIIYSKTFSRNTLLEIVRLSANPGLVLEGGVLANLTSLKIVELSYNQFTDIPEDTFENCLKLEEIDLSNNNLTTIPERLFTNLVSLRILDMSKNKLNSVPDSVFATLVKLNVLKLGNNNLTSISEKFFRSLHELKTLELQKNLIDSIESRAFASLDKLTDLDLSFNKWNNSYVTSISHLGFLQSIETLNLKHNQLEDIPELLSTLNLRKLDLSYNQVKYLPLHSFIHKTNYHLEVNLNYNKLHYVDFMLTDFADRKTATTTIRIDGNPIECDCSMYDLARYNHDDMDLKLLLNIVQDELICANDNNTTILEVKPTQVECPVIYECPNDCNCSYKPFYTAMMVNCSFVGLKSYPKIGFSSEKFSYNQTFLVLRGNNLTTGPAGNEENYDNITVLDLSRNSIAEFSWIPSKILELNLDENFLDNLNKSLIDQLKNTTSVRKLTLKDNPWHCSCKSADLQKFLIQNDFVVNSSDVYCENFQTKLVDKTDICKVSPFLSILLFTILAMLVMCTITFALYYRYQSEIKVYLFAKSVCLWFVTEDELDKDKTYDVFVSYAQPDEKFVEEHLLPELERNDNPYKVCIHIRDWVPGQFIAEQVVNSVRDSRRTLVVLSNNFLNSVWGKLEFKTAHTQAVRDGRARVIIVMYGDLDENKLDDELKSYLKTNTYVKWGDQFFWSKLKYALQHAKGQFRLSE